MRGIILGASPACMRSDVLSIVPETRSGRYFDLMSEALYCSVCITNIRKVLRMQYNESICEAMQ